MFVRYLMASFFLQKIWREDKLLHALNHDVLVMYGRQKFWIWTSEFDFLFIMSSTLLKIICSAVFGVHFPFKILNYFPIISFLSQYIIQTFFRVCPLSTQSDMCSLPNGLKMGFPQTTLTLLHFWKPWKKPNKVHPMELL